MKKLLALIIVVSLIVVAAPARAATYTVTNAKSATTVLSVVDVVNFGSGCGGTFIVFNRSGTGIWTRVDGTDPTVDGDLTHFIPANESRLVYVVSNLQIRLITSAAATYTVECF